MSRSRMRGRPYLWLAATLASLQQICATSVESNLGTWPTAFSPPTSCSFITVFASAIDATVYTRAGVAYAASSWGISPSLGTSCYPSGYGTFDDDAGNYFSPASACPTGYSMDQTTTNGDLRAVCCPSGYGQHSLSRFICTSIFNGNLTASKRVGTNANFTGTGQRYDLFTKDGGSPYTFASATNTITASGVQIRWPIPPSSGTASASGTAQATSDNSTSSGLSTGAKIGIGLGIPLLVLIVAATVTICLIQRRNRQHVQEESALPNGTHQPMSYDEYVNTGNVYGTSPAPTYPGVNYSELGSGGDPGLQKGYYAMPQELAAPVDSKGMQTMQPDTTEHELSAYSSPKLAAATMHGAQEQPMPQVTPPAQYPTVSGLQEGQHIASPDAQAVPASVQHANHAQS